MSACRRGRHSSSAQRSTPLRARQRCSGTLHCWPAPSFPPSLPPSAPTCHNHRVAALGAIGGRNRKVLQVVVVACQGGRAEGRDGLRCAAARAAAHGAGAGATPAAHRAACRCGWVPCSQQPGLGKAGRRWACTNQAGLFTPHIHKVQRGKPPSLRFKSASQPSLRFKSASQPSRRFTRRDVASPTK